MTQQDVSADFELRVSGHQGRWALTTRLRRQSDQADVERGPFLTALEPDQLLPLSGEPAAYGAALCHMLFATQEALAAFASARAAALDAGRRLRVRLHLPDDLQGLRWETLADPVSGRLLALEGELALLSRYLPSDDDQAVPLRHSGELRALVAVAAPRDPERYGLAPLGFAEELQRVTGALAGVRDVTVLGGPTAPVTWERLEARLGQGCDLLYLVAHGSLADERPLLYLEQEDSTTFPVAGALLVDMIRSLGPRRPRLVVLASCESAGSLYADATAALGPQLARAGVAAVLAMQGQVSTATGAQFAGRFFAELAADGFADRAASVARAAVRTRDDWWMPVLYTRLNNGRLWGEAPEGQPAPPVAVTFAGPVSVDNSKLIDFGNAQIMGNVRVGDVVKGDLIKIGEQPVAEPEDDALDPAAALPMLSRRVAVARNVPAGLRDEAAAELGVAAGALASGNRAKARQRVEEALSILRAMDNGYVRAIVRKLEALLQVI